MISPKWAAALPKNSSMNSKLIPFACLLIPFLLITFRLSAQQAHFTASGTIVFEKKINMYALIARTINKDNEVFLNQAFDAFKKSQPQFKTMSSTLSFAGNKTLFVPVEEEPGTGIGLFSNNPEFVQNNTIYTDLNIHRAIARKKVFDADFLVSDSVRIIKWKITNETREIAGYTCRRANAIVLDSIYVVAFYTTDIPVSGGPESFSGLPGMILGVALPHENTTWFATRVTDKVLAPETLTAPKKGKPADNKAFRAMLKSTFKNWGTEAPMYFKAFLL